MLIGLLALAGIGIAVAASSKPSTGSSGVVRLALVGGDGFDAIDRMFTDAEKRGVALREQRDREARAELNKYADVAQSIPIVGYVIGPVIRSLWLGGLETGTRLAKAITKDPQWNSPANKERAKDLVASIATLGFAPYTPAAGMDDDYASWGARLQEDLDKTRELFAKRPDVAALWSLVRGWVAANENSKTMKDLRSIGAWPFSPDGRNRMKAAALATVFAAMRGKDPSVTRAAVDAAYSGMMKTDLRLADHRQWALGAIIEAADRATR